MHTRARAHTHTHTHTHTHIHIHTRIYIKEISIEKHMVVLKNLINYIALSKLKYFSLIGLIGIKNDQHK